MRSFSMLLSVAALLLGLCLHPVMAWDKETFAYKEKCIQQNEDVNSTAVPRKFGMLVFPSWEHIDVWGPIQVFKIVARSYHLELAIIAETLDPVSSGPRAPKFNLVNSSFYPSITPTHTLTTAPNLDVLIIPGGGGTREPEMENILKYIRNTYPKVKYLLTVCTGSLLAGRAGVLDGKRATTNKGAWAEVTKWVPAPKWQPHARWVVDGNIWTSSGLSAGIDASLEFVECIYGEAVAKGVTEGMELERHPDPRWDPYAVVSAGSA